MGSVATGLVAWLGSRLSANLLWLFPLIAVSVGAGVLFAMALVALAGFMTGVR